MHSPLSPSIHRLLWQWLLPSQPSWWQQPDELEKAVGNSKSAGSSYQQGSQLSPINHLTGELCCHKSSSDLFSLCATKETLHIRSHTLHQSIHWFNIGFGAESIKYKWKWNISSPLTKYRSLNSYKSHFLQYLHCFPKTFQQYKLFILQRQVHTTGIELVFNTIEKLLWPFYLPPAISPQKKQLQG